MWERQKQNESFFLYNARRLCKNLLLCGRPVSAFRMVIKRLLKIYLLCLSILLSSSAQSDLPSLGDASSGAITAKQEYKLGQAFLKLLYSQTDLIEDPEIIHYVESLCYKLAEVSNLQDHRLSIIVIDDSSLNAFAAPGGIIGVNRGLFSYAHTEHEFAAVIAHELAHLSQRHYARTLEAAKRQELPSAIALLGSIALAAVSGNAGVAALSATMAGMQSQQLRFSRDHEMEADNIGIKTMYAAHMDPKAMPIIFERMGQLEIQQQQLEFLRTHPVTQSRISDASNRAEQYPVKDYSDNLNYHLMREKLKVLFSKDASQPITTSSNIVSQDKYSRLYGQALVAYEQENWKAANKYLNTLQKDHTNNLYLKLMQARVLFAEGKREQSIKQLKTSVQLYPDNLPVVYTTASLLFQNKNYKEAQALLEDYTRSKPQYPFVWRELADIAGKSGNIILVHKARAEYLFLTGNFSTAIKHLEYALTLTQKNPSAKIAIKQRILEIKAYMNELKKI